MARTAAIRAFAVLLALSGSAVHAATPAHTAKAPFDLSGVWMNDDTLDG